ncbi:MAG: HAMP domain-containing histidine kinase [Proteobacteria bacterium]|nr:HAMP domain-containing histidine kinase [Pseudomonadota bacterium]
MSEAARGRRALGSTTVRLAFALALTQIVTLALGLAIMSGLTQRTLDNEARAAAEVARDDLLADHRTVGEAGMQRALNERLASSDDINFVAYLRGADGRRIAGNLAAWPQGAGTKARWTVAMLTRTDAQRPDPVGYVIQPLPGGEALLTGQVLEAQSQITRAREQSFIYALLAGLGIAAFASWMILRVLERRINQFNQTADDFAAGQLTSRVALSRSGDAFDRLGEAINAMLDRIATLVGELRAVTDSMAHDLRSPVARIRSSLERSLGETHDPAARNALADAIDEADGLQRLLDSALEISRAEAGIGRNQFVAFDLSEMVRDLAEVYGPLAEDEGFAIVVDAPDTMAVVAHRELLFRALSNLIDNALKYAGGGSRITMALADGGTGGIRLSVADDGPGIPPEDREEAMRRFGRLDPARTRSGAGLGMALVGTIATLHGGKMELDQAKPHGLAVNLDLPIGAAE